MAVAPKPSNKPSAGYRSESEPEAIEPVDFSEDGEDF